MWSCMSDSEGHPPLSYVRLFSVRLWVCRHACVRACACVFASSAQCQAPTRSASPGAVPHSGVGAGAPGPSCGRTCGTHASCITADHSGGHAGVPYKSQARPLAVPHEQQNFKSLGLVGRHQTFFFFSEFFGLEECCCVPTRKGLWGEHNLPRQNGAMSTTHRDAKGPCFATSSPRARTCVCVRATLSTGLLCVHFPSFGVHQRLRTPRLRRAAQGARARVQFPASLRHSGRTSAIWGRPSPSFW
mmetsp:Transcript_30681/g.49481  ORF Transcript_30681/g.49481 Transcript_30681/m.49481 type:complete len:245 (+) Transcript_30681:69-803(+)